MYDKKVIKWKFSPQSCNDTCSLSLGTISKNKEMFYSSQVTQLISYNLWKFA